MAQPPNQVVRARIAELAPAANLGHRGAGSNHPGRALPENSIASFVAAMRQGAHGVELDVELTADGKLVTMHDDTLDRTTTGVGCVSARTLAEVQAYRLLNGDRQETSEHPPTLEQVYRALPSDAIVNVELKVYDAPCRTATSAAPALAVAAVREVQRLGVSARTIFSSFDEEAIATVKHTDPSLYAALLFAQFDAALIERAKQLQLDAIHPYFKLIPADAVRAACSAGLQVNVWTVDGRDHMGSSLLKGVSAIITNQPGVLREVLATRR